MNSPIPGTTIQSLMFPKALYTPARAASWAKRNGFEGSAPDVGSDTAAMIRVRLKAPKRFVKGSFKTALLEDGVKAVVGVPVARRNPLRRNTVVGDHVQVHGYTRKLPKQARRLPVPAPPVIVEAPAQQQAKPVQSADDKRYFAALKKKYYALVADTVEAMKQKQWLHAETLSRAAEDILLGDGWHTKWGQAALSPLYALKKKIHKARHPYSQNPSQEATMAGRPKSRARRNPVHLRTSYGPGDKGKHRVLDQALDVAAMAKSLPVHKVYTFVSPANAPENAVAKIDVVLDGSQVASFLVKPKTHTVVMTAGPVDRWFHESEYRTSSDAIRKIAKWAEGATAKSNPRARRNPLAVNPSRKAGAYALFVKSHIRKHLNAGLSAPEAMRAVAAEWRAKKAGAMRANPRKRR